jgi:hypothetical protein
MTAIQQIFTQYGSQYLAAHGNRMPAVHKKVVRAIQKCRSGSFGTAMYKCDWCEADHLVGCCCGNRHCPVCQQHKADAWVHKQLQRLMPCHYFLVTFTVPEALRRFIRSRQRLCYEALFASSIGAMKKLAADVRFVGSSRIGALGVLHTWGGQLPYHPHVHYIVPGGAVSKDGNSWLSSRQDFFVHVRPLSAIFKAKFRDAMRAARLLDEIDPSVWKQNWVVHCTHAGNGENTLRYLARYLFRVAISNARIIRVQDRKVSFKYRDKESDKGKWRTITLDVIEFMRRFLQHVLPTGFMKVRHFGFLNGNFSVPIERIKALVCAFYHVLRDNLPLLRPSIPEPPRCRRCGGILHLIRVFSVTREVPSG